MRFDTIKENIEILLRGGFVYILKIEKIRVTEILMLKDIVENPRCELQDFSYLYFSLSRDILLLKLLMKILIQFL